ncbi:MAG: hypothetical protein JXA03_15650 [Bacteroidales bacterium]|nr:hypothetical protein [Bacteroidales bacterium]
MVRRISIGIVIFFGALLINLSAMAFQQRYDRRERGKVDDPFAIELTDHHVLKFLKNTWLWDYPLKKSETVDYECYLYFDYRGAGEKYIFTTKTFTHSQLKFVLIHYEGFFSSGDRVNTLYWNG